MNLSVLNPSNLSENTDFIYGYYLLLLLLLLLLGGSTILEEPSLLHI
jgi:hypothetical protein